MTYALFILSGSVQEKFDNFYFRKGAGSVLNPLDLFYEEMSKGQLLAVTPVVLLKIKKD